MGTPCAKTRHMTYRSLRTVHPFFAQLTLLPNLKIVYFTMLFNRPDTSKSAPFRGKYRFPSNTSSMNSGWRRGVVVSVVRRMNEVTLRRARLVLGWVTVSKLYTITVRNEPTRSTQTGIPPGSLNRVPASAGVKAGMSSLPGGR